MEQSFIKLSGEIGEANTFILRLQGLMFKKHFPNDYQALALKPCDAIHTMFMRFPIDVLFLSTDNEVLAAIHAMKPWRVSKRVKKARTVLELPAGIIGHYGIYPGDLLDLQ